jgi:hypothetical protein
MMRSHLIQDFEQLRSRFVDLYEVARGEVAAGRDVIVALDYVPATDGQRKHLHRLVGDIEKQVIWYGNRLNKTEWKRMLSASLKKTKIIPGTDHESFVLVGDPTSNMDRKTYADLILLAEMFGAEHGVRWSMTRDEMAYWRAAA